MGPGPPVAKCRSYDGVRRSASFPTGGARCMMLETAFCGGDGPSSLQSGVHGRDADPRPIHLRRCERLAAARMVGLARGNAKLRSSLRRPGCAGAARPWHASLQVPTVPRYTLPTVRLISGRSCNSSASRPSSRMATRVSRGPPLIMISLFNATFPGPFRPDARQMRPVGHGPEPFNIGAHCLARHRASHGRPSFV